MAELHPVPAPPQRPGDERRAGRDEPREGVTFGVLGGLDSLERQAVRLGWAIGIGIVVLVMIIDVVTRAHDRPDTPVFFPAVDEASSALITATLLWLVCARVAVWMRRTAPPLWLAAVVNVTAAAVYSVVHVGGFVVIRKLTYAAVGQTYTFGPIVTEYLYEATKDVLAYTFGVVSFGLVMRVVAGQAALKVAPATFDIHDGARLLRIPLGEILAIRSAGNYAEFLLADGRRPLMRASLGSLETRLEAGGLVRTHRSWLVNRACVRGLRPEGSGDYAVELGAVEAPLSRRYRTVLKSLRG